MRHYYRPKVGLGLGFPKPSTIALVIALGFLFSAYVTAVLSV